MNRAENEVAEGSLRGTEEGRKIDLALALAVCAMVFTAVNLMLLFVSAAISSQTLDKRIAQHCVCAPRS